MIEHFSNLSSIFKITLSEELTDQGYKLEKIGKKQKKTTESLEFILLNDKDKLITIGADDKDIQISVLLKLFLKSKRKLCYFLELYFMKEQLKQKGRFYSYEKMWLCKTKTNYHPANMI